MKNLIHHGYCTSVFIYSYICVLIMQNKEYHTCENDGTNTEDHTFKIIADKLF